MTTLRFQLRLVLVIAIIVGSGGQWHLVGEEQKNIQMTTIRAQDIPKTAQIVGRLGHPLGSLVTVRGQWISPGTNLKDRLQFHVMLVNGKQPAEPIELDEMQVEKIFPLHKAGRKTKPGESWDWRFDWRESESPPVPKDGETWEMMGVETGAFEDYSAEAWKEIGGGGRVAAPPYRKGFYSRFEFITVKIVK